MKRLLILALALSCWASPSFAQHIDPASGGSGGAPTDATYLTTTSDGTLSNEVVIGVVDDTTIVGNGSTLQAKTLPSCSNGTTSKLLYNSTTNEFSCGTDQDSGAGSGMTHPQVMARTSLGF